MEFNGTRGTIIAYTKQGQVVVEFNDGSRLIVSPKALIAQRDGTYRLSPGATEQGEVVIPVIAEELTVERQRVARGKVRVNKRVESKARTDLKLSDPAKSDNVLEVIEEELQVGKEKVERGRMRIYNVVSEREVKKDIGLKDETLRVQRRPVSRAVQINPDLFKERSFEMVEMDEIAKVGKTARVVEEVSLGKEVADKVETIKETLRRQDVQIEEIPAARLFKEYDTDFRKFYSTNLANSGASYENLLPAFHYGYDLAVREPFRSSPWSAVEADSRKIWEEKNPAPGTRIRRSSSMPGRRCAPRVSALFRSLGTAKMKRDHGSKRKGGNNGTNGRFKSLPFVPLFPPFLLDP